MRKKTIIVSLVAIMLCIAIGIGVYFAMNNHRVDNIFDEMYVSILEPKSSEVSFYYTKGMGRLVNDADWPHSYSGVYSKQALLNGENIIVTVNLEEQSLIISATTAIEGTRCLRYFYRYNYKDQILTIEPISLFTYRSYDFDVEQDITDGKQIAAFLQEHNITRSFIDEYCNYFLYEKVLADWLRGNGERSQFTTDDYGQFTLVDDLYANLEDFISE